MTGLIKRQHGHKLYSFPHFRALSIGEIFNMAQRKPMSEWSGQDLKHWAAKIGCKFMNQLAPIVQRRTGTIHQYSAGTLPIPLEVQEKILKAYELQLKKDQDELFNQQGSMIQAQMFYEDGLTVAPPRQQGRNGTHLRLPGYFGTGGVPIAPNDTPYPEKWLTAAQAQLVRDALKHWATEVAKRYKLLDVELYQREHRLELLNIKSMLAAAPRPDNTTQPWLLTVCQWPVLSRALRNYYHATNTMHAYSFYQCIRRNLGQCKKLSVGNAGHRATRLDTSAAAAGSNAAAPRPGVLGNAPDSGPTT